jgi:hypothetical protein
MEIQEVIEIMNKPRSTIHIGKYRQIYKMATGQDWTKCFCGNGFDTFYRTCKNYSNALQAQLKQKENG